MTMTEFDAPQAAPRFPSQLAPDHEPAVDLRAASGTLEHPVAWARLWAIANPPRTRPMLRTGAWYPVVATDPTAEVVVSVRHREVRLPARLFEMRKDRPRRFTVVCRSKHERNPARGTRRDLGHKYAVCPASGHRIPLRGMPTVLECPGCAYRGEIAWHETG